MRYNVNRINAGSPLQVSSYLGKTVRRAVQNKHLRWLGKAFDQRLIVGDTTIDEDDALGHGVDPHKAAYFGGVTNRAKSLACTASSRVLMRTSPKKRRFRALSLLLRYFYFSDRATKHAQAMPQTGKRPSPIWGIWTRLV